MLRRAALLSVRWVIVAVLSLIMTFPFVLGVTLTGMHMEEQKYYAQYGKAPPGEKDLGLGFVGLGAFVFYSLASFAIAWPIALWGSYKLAKRFPRAKGNAKHDA